MADQDDPFESLLFLEESCHKDGYDEGWIIGRRKGLSVGRSLGMDKGKEIGSEIGYYAGFVSTWLFLVDKSDKKGASCKTFNIEPMNTRLQDFAKLGMLFLSRIHDQLQNLISLITQLSITDPTDENLFSCIEKVRAKFKQVCSLLGVSPEGRVQEEMLSF